MMVISNVVYYHHRGRAMSNVRVPVELYAQLTLGCLMGEDGLVDISDSALSAMIEIVKKAQRTSTRKERVDLSDSKVLADYEGKLTALLKQNMVEVANGGKLISEKASSRAIGLDETTVRKNSTLHQIYLTYKRSMSNSAPTTLDNDADADWDEDFD